MSPATFQGRFKGRVAVVTGGASGAGKPWPSASPPRAVAWRCGT